MPLFLTNSERKRKALLISPERYSLNASCSRAQPPECSSFWLFKFSGHLGVNVNYIVDLQKNTWSGKLPMLYQFHFNFSFLGVTTYRLQTPEIVGPKDKLGRQWCVYPLFSE